MNQMPQTHHKARYVYGHTAGFFLLYVAYME